MLSMASLVGLREGMEFAATAANDAMVMPLGPHWTPASSFLFHILLQVMRPSFTVTESLLDQLLV